MAANNCSLVHAGVDVAHTAQHGGGWPQHTDIVEEAQVTDVIIKVAFR